MKNLKKFQISKENQKIVKGGLMKDAPESHGQCCRWVENKCVDYVSPITPYCK